MKKKFLIVSEYGELLDLASHLENVEGHEVLFHIAHKDYKNIGKGIVTTTDDSMVNLGKGYTWIFDGCSRGKRQDFIRSQGEPVFGGSEIGDQLENDRQKGQKWFTAAGFKQPESKNFTDIDSAIQFVTGKNKKYILKQNGDAPKSINHKGKFDTGEDMLFHLEELKKKWNEQEYGKVDFDLMEVVEGVEVAASAFFNGKNFMKNKDGKVVGYLNFEEKKESNEEMGETVGEMGTTFIGVTEDNPLFKEILLKPKIIQVLRDSKFRGVFDINCIKTKDGIVALEPTMRPGVPATSYEFMEGLDMNTGEMIDAVAKGEDIPVEIKQGYGMVICIVAKPFPLEGHVEKEESSIGERLWIMKDGKPINDFTPEQKKHIHLYNFEKKEGDESKKVWYTIATKNGYLLTVTGTGDSIENVRDTICEYIKSNVYISGMKYRTDIGSRLEGGVSYKEKLKTMEDKHKKELETIKAEIRNIVYDDNE